MNNAGVYTLAAVDLTAALTAQAYTAIEDLEGMSEASLDVYFQYGSGGTTCVVTISTSFDGGTTWVQIARFEFTTATRRATAKLGGGASWDVATYAALSVEGIRDGVLGDRLRAEITSTGTYANTTVGVRASVR